MIRKQAPARRLRPADDAIGWTIQQPCNETWHWTIHDDFAGRHLQYLESTKLVDHAGGKRSVTATCPLDTLLDSLAATNVGRKAMLDALVRREARLTDSLTTVVSA